MGTSPAFQSSVGRWLRLTLRDAAWLPLVVLAAHLIAAYALRLYQIVPQLDIPLHLLGGAAIGWLAHRGIANAEPLDLWAAHHPITHVVSCMGVVALAAVLWECAEFIADALFAVGAQRGLTDTMKDLALGLIGGALSIVAIIGVAGSIKQPMTRVGERTA